VRGFDRSPARISTIAGPHMTQAGFPVTSRRALTGDAKHPDESGGGKYDT